MYNKRIQKLSGQFLTLRVFSDFDLRELKSEQAIELGRRLNKVVPSISSAHRKILL